MGFLPGNIRENSGFQALLAQLLKYGGSEKVVRKGR
jgi:hypothetical protein